MLAKIIHQTVHTTKPPPNSSLTDEQLQQITQLKPPASSVPLTPESKEPKVTLHSCVQARQF